MTKKVYLSPGHGRRPNGTLDPGAVGGGTNEQEAGDIAARAVERYLLDNYEGVEVQRQPRGGPNFSGTRAEIDKYRPDIALELHHDWIRAPRGGFGFHRGGVRERICKALQSAYVAEGLPTRGHYRSLPGTNSEPGLYGASTQTVVLWEIDRIGEYTSTHAVAIANGIAAFLGLKAKRSDPKPPPTPKPTPTPEPLPSKSISQMAQEVIEGLHGTGHDNRRRSLGVIKSVYEQVRAEVNRRLLGTPAPTPAPKKTVAQMAQEVLDGKHGNGHDTRRRSLGISLAEYEKVRAEVNRRAGGGTPTPTPTPRKSIAQMATEVIDGKHGTGHAARRRSLGVSASVYDQVRTEVNRRLLGSGSSKSIAQMATEVIDGKHGTGHAARRRSLGISQAQYEKVRAEVNRRLQ